MKIIRLLIAALLAGQVSLQTLAAEPISATKAKELDALGMRYLRGDGVKKDSKMAFSFFDKASRAGQASAEMHLAQLLESGEGVKKNPERAFGLMKRAAEKGLAEAQNHLGWMYQKGVGTDPNLGKAIQWFRRSAEKGSAAAMYNLGVSYEKGAGVRMDSAKAVELFRNSAQNGNANAQFMLGVFYLAGIGVKQDLAEGHRWFALASCPTRWSELPETAHRWKSAENDLTNVSLENTNEWFQSHANRGSRFVKEKLNDWMP